MDRGYVNEIRMNVDSQLSAWGKRLVKLMETNERIIVMCADLITSCKLQPVQQAFSDRVINTGIAEQNMVGIAAGLASEGFQPFIFSFATFLSMRACEQIRTDVFYNNLDVKIIGTHSGVSTGAAGPTHFSLEDIGIIRAMPASRIVVPSDVSNSLELLDNLVKTPGPIYIRLDRNPLPDIYSEETQLQNEYSAVNVLRRGSDGVLIATGTAVRAALDAADELSKRGPSMTVIDIPVIKPLDKTTLVPILAMMNFCVTVEEHNKFGGLGSAIAELIATEVADCRLYIIANEDLYPKGGPFNELRKNMGLTSDNIIHIIEGHFAHRSH